MMSGVEARLDGSTLVVHIPMRFQRRGGRKRIVAPDGSEHCARDKWVCPGLPRTWSTSTSIRRDACMLVLAPAFLHDPRGATG